MFKPIPVKQKKATTFAIAEEQKKSFTTFFGAKVDVKVAGNGKGKITIPFHSEEDFEIINTISRIYDKPNLKVTTNPISINENFQTIF